MQVSMYVYLVCLLYNVCMYVCMYVYWSLFSYLFIYFSSIAGPSTLHLSSPFPILSDTSCRSDNEKAIQELKSMLTASIEARDRANIEKTVSSTNG